MWEDLTKLNATRIRKQRAEFGETYIFNELDLRSYSTELLCQMRFVLLLLFLCIFFSFFNCLVLKYPVIGWVNLICLLNNLSCII